MLKRLIILSLALFYINASSGIGVRFHYCMGELVSMAFGHDTDHKNACGDCGMDTKESSCCKDESILLKVYDGHHPSSISFNTFKYLFDTNFIFSGSNKMPSYSGFQFSIAHHESYSGRQTNKRYIILSVFRI
ncbi:MAG: HYC_CC_PP family protein [Bacteroidota bacterium]